MNRDELPDSRLWDVARRLGATAGDRVDADATAQAVLARLREQPPVVVPWRRPAWLAIAAAVVLMVGAGAVLRHARRQVERAPAGATLDLGGLSADQLHQVLTAVEEPLGDSTVTPADVGIEDLSAPELRSLLRSLEG